MLEQEVLPCCTMQQWKALKSEFGQLFLPALVYGLGGISGLRRNEEAGPRVLKAVANVDYEAGESQESHKS